MMLFLINYIILVFTQLGVPTHVTNLVCPYRDCIGICRWGKIQFAVLHETMSAIFASNTHYLDQYDMTTNHDVLTNYFPMVLHEVTYEKCIQYNIFP